MYIYVVIYMYVSTKNIRLLLLVGDGYQSEVKSTNLTFRKALEVHDVHFGLSELCLKAGSGGRCRMFLSCFNKKIGGYHEVGDNCSITCKTCGS